METSKTEATKALAQAIARVKAAGVEETFSRRLAGHDHKHWREFSRLVSKSTSDGVVTYQFRTR